MKALPYFRWYPADAETDAAYSAMSWAERGFYHWCLNYSWINDGLPPDLGELARAAKITRRELDKLWIRVGLRFPENSGVLRNSRQEEERAHATAKSRQSSRAAAERERQRIERSSDDTSDDHPRASTRAGSDSVSCSSVLFSEKEPEGKLFAETAEIDQSLVRPAAPAKDETFDRFWKAYWNKQAKEKTRKAWPAIAARFGAEFLIAECAADRARWESSKEWEWRGNLHALTWLHGKRWEDQPPQERPKLVKRSAIDIALDEMEAERHAG